MRRIVGFVLLGLGVFAVVLGLMLRFYAYPRLAKAPLDPQGVSVASGSGVIALVFESEEPGGPATPVIRQNLTLTANRYVTGDLTSPEVQENGDVASWIEALTIVDQNGNLVKATERQLCVDRHTAEAVEPCTVRYIKATTDPRTLQVVKEDGTPQPGVNLKFPFDTQKTSYQMYDLTIRASAEARFDGEEEVNGLDTYRFVQEIPPTKVEERVVPGSLVGDTEPSVQADLYYQNRRTMWVEPATGLIVKGQESQHQELVQSDEQPGQGTVVFDGTLAFTDQTVDKNVSDANDNLSKLWLLTGLPVYLWIGGALLIVAALFLLLGGGRGRRAVVHRSPEDDRELSGTTT
ncbi:DUF3068 domain-containing protein [Actinophytocola sp.]|uniref:DUF3068 domain-containing protein n=1 Tax=Actinophytocola sp. TaxID=1872138 RepID=UPI002D80C8ED|nr:DUF3068 domain-containing protein [Actinophytocola sp.]HET9144205.1 DUF3068 domain-containing protein [Actinophytocola sp.]